MENIKSKIVVFNYSNHSLILYENENEIHFQPLSEEVFEDALITFNDNGNITLEGECWEYGIIFSDEYPKNLDYEVHPSYVSKTKFRHKDIVRSGWHRKLKNEHKKIIVNDYVIIQNEK